MKDIYPGFPTDEMTLLLQEDVILDALVVKYYDYIQSVERVSEEMYAGICFAVLTLGGKESLASFEFKWETYASERGGVNG